MKIATMKQVESDTEDAPTARSSHPSYEEMVKEAITALNYGRKGSSKKAIKNYLIANYTLGKDSIIESNLKRALNGCVETGAIVNTTGRGLIGSFRLIKQKPVGKRAKNMEVISDEEQQKSMKSSKATKKSITAKSPTVPKITKKGAAVKSPKVMKKNAAVVKTKEKMDLGEAPAKSKPKAAPKAPKKSDAIGKKTKIKQDKEQTNASQPKTKAAPKTPKGAAAKSPKAQKVAKKNAAEGKIKVKTEQDEPTTTAKSKQKAAPKKVATASKMTTPKAKKEMPAKETLKRTKAMNEVGSAAGAKKARKN